MKYLKLYEQFMLLEAINLLENRLGTEKINQDHELRISRTSNGQSIKVAVVDIRTNKTVSVAYLMHIKQVNGVLQAEVRRLHTTKSMREMGWAGIVADAIVNRFGDMLLYGYASPNRIGNQDKELFKDRLFKMYAKYGFIRTSGNKVVREPTQLNESRS
jgi:hypothetical protein